MKHRSEERLANRKVLRQTQPIDLIGEELRCDIEQYRLHSFESFDLNVVVCPSSAGKRKLSNEGHQIGFDRYRFDIFGELPKHMQVHFVRKGEVLIRYLDQWTPVSSFLKHLKPPVEWNGPGNFPRQEGVRRRWEQQARWWLANGKRFRLLNLPAEIREIIYGHVFGTFIEPYPTCKARRLGPSTFAMLHRMPNANLLWTCKLVYEEASSILFDYTPFLI